MGMHGSAGTFGIAIADQLHDALMLEEAMMIGGAICGIPQPAPDNGPAHGVQRVEQREQKRVARCAGNQPVQAVVAILIMPPGPGLARGSEAVTHLGDLCRRCPEGCLGRKHRLDEQPRMHDLAGFEAWAISAIVANSSPGRMPMKVPLPTWRHSSPWPSRIASALAQLAARHAKDLAKLALGR